MPVTTDDAGKIDADAPRSGAAGAPRDDGPARPDPHEARGDAPDLFPGSLDGDTLNWRLVVGVALGLAFGLLLAEFLGGIVTRLQGLLITLVLSLFLSFAMEPAVQWMAQRGIRRGFGTLLVFLGAFVLIGGFIAALSTLVVGQVQNLVQEGPSLLNTLADQAGRLPGDLGESAADFIMRQSEQLPDRLPEIAGNVGRGALGVGTTVLGAVIQVLTILLVTFYLVADGPRLRRTLSSRLAPARQREFLAVWELAIGKTGGYVYSRLLTAVVSAAVHTVAFLLLDIPYAFALGGFVGVVSSLIPVIGTYLAGALPLLVALAESAGAVIGVLAVVVVYQQIENYLIAPRINAATMALHPAVAFVSVLIGAALLGAAGALLALPAAAIVAALISAYGERHDVMEHGLTADDDPTARATA